MGVLDDLDAWDTASPVAQDVALDSAARALGPGFVFEGAAVVGPRMRRVGRFHHRRSGLLFHLLPGGAFTAGRSGGAPEEGPVRPASVTPLLVARTPVTQAAWDRLMGGGDRRLRNDPALPVAGVSWGAAHDWLALAGDCLRLPAEAEWEWACRAGTSTAFWWGDRPDLERGWVQETSDGGPRPVADAPDRGHGFGLVDPAGNVSEWCQDDLDAPMQGSAWQEWDPGKVHRGGSWDQPWTRARSAWRSGADPKATWPDLGFRPVRDLV